MKRIAAIPAPNLEVRDLRLVLALGAAGTTAGAADVLHLAQPSVSRALLSLEDRLGTQLFERKPKGLVLTAAGQRLAADASALLTDIHDLEGRVREPPAPATRIRLVCECHTAYHWLPSTLVMLERELPDVRLALRLEHTDDAVEALNEGKIDAALVTSGVKASDTLRVAKLFADEIVFIVPTSHPLASRAHLSARDLRDHQLFSAKPTPHEARWFSARIFGRARPQLRIQFVPLTEAIVDLVRAGLGVGVLTEWIAGPYVDRGGLVVKRFAKGLARKWQLAWRRELGPAGPRLLRALRTSPRAC